jgi:hypothetical protein
MSTPLDICSSLKSTSAGLMVNGCAFYTVMRLVHVLILQDKCGLSVPKRQPTKVRSGSITVYDCPKIRHLVLFSSRGVDGPRILGDHDEAWLHSDTMHQFVELCTRCLWPNDNGFDLSHHAPKSDSDCSRAWFNYTGEHFDELSPHPPDLNYMENLWVGLKRRVESRSARSKGNFHREMGEHKSVILFLLRGYQQ